MPTIEGPAGTRRVTRDAWGYPRVAVHDHREAAWMMGHLHATDRLLQVRLQLLAAQGRMMELLGDRPLTRTIDRSVRLVGLAADLDAQLAHVDEQTLRFAESYCAGFNAGARDNAAGRRALSRLLGIPDAPYTPRDMIALYRLTTWFGLNSLTQTCALAVGLLASRFAASATARDDLRLLWGDAVAEIDLAALAETAWPEALTDLLVETAPRGSNAFAVAGAHTSTGAPLMMSEFHLEVGQIPPLLYALHLDIGDDRFLHGVSVPGLATVAAGRNESVGWTYTFGHAANVDVWLERCDRGQRVTPDGPAPLDARIETVKIRRGALAPPAEEQWRVWTSPHGAMVGDPGTTDGPRTLPAVRWRGMERTYDDLNALLRVPFATSIDELVEAHEAVSLAALAATLVDRDGHIAYVQTGDVGAHADRWIPRRGWCDRDDADGPDAPKSAAERPRLMDPERGYIASANEHHEGWTAFAEPHFRHARLDERLTAMVDRARRGEAKVQPADLIELSYDHHDGLAAAVARCWGPDLEGLDGVEPVLTWARDQPAHPTAAQAGHRATVHALHREVIRHLVRDRFDEPTAHWLTSDPAVVLGLHLHLDRVLFELDVLPDVPLTSSMRRDLVRRAWASLRARDTAPGVDGPVQARMRFRHLLEGDATVRTPLSRPEVELPGGPVSPFQTRASIIRGHRIVTGPAFHLLIDMSVDVTRYNIAGGASELPWGPGYAAGIEAWRTGSMLALGGKQPSRSR